MREDLGQDFLTRAINHWLCDVCPAALRGQGVAPADLDVGWLVWENGLVGDAQGEEPGGVAEGEEGIRAWSLGCCFCEAGEEFGGREGDGEGFEAGGVQSCAEVVGVAEFGVFGAKLEPEEPVLVEFSVCIRGGFRVCDCCWVQVEGWRGVGVGSWEERCEDGAYRDNDDVICTDLYCLFVL